MSARGKVLTVLAFLLGLPGCSFLLPDFGIQTPDLFLSADLDAEAQDLSDATADLDADVWDLSGVDLPYEDLGQEDAPAWNCHVGLEYLETSTYRWSFADHGMGSVRNMLSVYYELCGDSEPVQSPETTYILTPQQAVYFTMSLDCQPPCKAWLMRDGCYYYNVQGCWQADLPLIGGLLLGAGLYVMGVEQPLQEGMIMAPPFSVHVAMNPLEPPADCAEDLAVRWSAMETAAGDTRRTALAPALDWTLADRIRTSCAASSDALGGMPEYALRFIPDFGDDKVRRLRIEVQPAKGATERLYLSVNGAGCGVTGKELLCASVEDAESLEEELLVFDGQELFVYLEADSDAALLETGPSAALVLTVEDLPF